MTENILVTSDGRIQNKITGNWIQGDINNAGYRRVQIFGKRHFIHRLVAQVWVSNPDNLPQVNHIDGNKLNNDKSNLEWVTASENQQHRYYTLKSGLGEASSNAKLTAHDVLKIRKCNENGESGRSLAKRFNISQTLVRNILSRKAWKHI